MAALNSNNIKIRMDKAIESFRKDLSSLRVGRASSTMLDTININAYGSIMPLNQISTVSVPESRLLLVSVWITMIFVSGFNMIVLTILSLIFFLFNSFITLLI